MRVIPLRPLLVVSVLCLFAACEKYPEDIPPWVREKIKYCAKDKNNCRGVSIDEYGYAGQSYYLLSYFNSFGYAELYDRQGEMVCSGSLDIGIGMDSCGVIPDSEIDFIRDIWSEHVD